MTIKIDLSDSAIVCVGATKGIARACVESFAQAGAALSLISRDAVALQRLADELREKYNSEIQILAADATSSDALECAVDRAIAHFGDRLSGLAPLVGSWNRGAPLHELTDDDWMFSYERILLPVVRSCRLLLPHFMRRGGGSIVTLGAYSVRIANPKSAHYSSMKAAIIHLTKNMAKTYGAQQIRANCVCPAVVISEDLEAFKAEAMQRYNVSEDRALWTYAREEFGAHYFLERLGELREVAAAVSFLMSAQASLITGAVLNVDGGTDF